jgi:brefeldin A-resistance guanine nucleotide exchange factor 1
MRVRACSLRVRARVDHIKAELEPASETKPYGLPSIREVLRVLISLLNPHDQQHTDSMRLMALSLLNVAFEIGGHSIGRFPVLRTLVADELCKYLFQVRKLSRTSELDLTSSIQISWHDPKIRPSCRLLYA